MRFALDELLDRLPLPATEKWPDGVWDVEVFRHGSMLLEVFAPGGVDHQTPHDQDEVYVVVRGRGTFVTEGGPLPFEAGDALFVAAGRPHHFEATSDDFVAWVLFWGPAGGEGSGAP